MSAVVYVESFNVSSLYIKNDDCTLILNSLYYFNSFNALDHVFKVKIFLCKFRCMFYLTYMSVQMKTFTIYYFVLFLKTSLHYFYIRNEVHIKSPRRAFQLQNDFQDYKIYVCVCVRASE